MLNDPKGLSSGVIEGGWVCVLCSPETGGVFLCWGGAPHQYPIMKHHHDYLQNPRNMLRG